MRSTHLKVCSLSWPPYCQFWQGLQGPKDPANGHNQVLILSGNRFCSHHSRNFSTFLIQFHLRSVPQGGSWWGLLGTWVLSNWSPLSFFIFSATVVKVLTKHWKSELVAELIMMCARRGALHWQLWTPLLFSFFIALFKSGALSGATNVNHIENVDQALLCMM